MRLVQEWGWVATDVGHWLGAIATAALAAAAPLQTPMLQLQRLQLLRLLLLPLLLRWNQQGVGVEWLLASA